MATIKQIVEKIIDYVDRTPPPGAVQFFALAEAPRLWLVCDGSAVSRTTYARLFSAIGTTFGDGDGSTTFNLPDLIDRFAQGGSSVGAVKDAGLPNITGTVKMHGQASQTPVYEVSGSFVATEKPAAYAELSSLRSTAAPSVGVFDFDAAQSSSIYGSSSTVQPPALVLLPCIKT